MNLFLMIIHLVCASVHVQLHNYGFGMFCFCNFLYTLAICYKNGDL